MVEILRVQVDAPIECVWEKNIVDETMHSVAEKNFGPAMYNDVGPLRRLGIIKERREIALSNKSIEQWA